MMPTYGVICAPEIDRPKAPSVASEGVAAQSAAAASEAASSPVFMP
jgi:hypothetical protein